MTELAAMVEATLTEYESGDVHRLLTSGAWRDVRRRTKDLMGELEVKGQPVAAARLDREYTRLADVLRDAASRDVPPKIRDDFALYDTSQEFLLTLQALTRFREAIDRGHDPRDGGASEGTKTARADAATNWREVQSRLHTLCEGGHPFPSYRKLAKRLGCAQSTVYKAVASSPRLAKWAAQHAKRAPAPRARSLTEVDLDRQASTREQEPGSEYLLHDEVERIMRELMEQAEPKERARLNEMTEDERRALAAVYLEQRRDLGSKRRR